MAIVLVAVEIAVVLWPRAAPRADSWLRRTRIDVAGEPIVAQTFVSHIDGLSAVKLFVRPSGADLHGVVKLQLTEVVDELEVPVHSDDVRFGQLGSDGTLVYRFPQIADSTGRRYRLAVSVPDVSQGSGASIEIVKGDPYDEGELTYNDIPRWADLRFQAEAFPRTYRSKFVSHWMRRQGPAVLPILAALAWLGTHVFALGAILMLGVRGQS